MIVSPGGTDVSVAVGGGSGDGGVGVGDWAGAAAVWVGWTGVEVTGAFVGGGGEMSWQADVPNRTNAVLMMNLSERRRCKIPSWYFILLSYHNKQ